MASMRFDLILSQGRIADRTQGALKGAALTAALIEKLIDGDRRVIGTPSPAAEDDWTASLSQAAGTLGGLREAVRASLDAGREPVMVANTCSASLASLPVVAERLPGATLLWIDAHGDFNTPDTTPSGFLGGMVLAAACGLWDSGHGAGLKPGQVIVVGARDIDAAEGEAMRRHGVRAIPPAEATPQRIAAEIGDAPVWVHIDWDALEPGFVPAAYKVGGGLTPAQVKAMLAALPPAQVAGIELAEFEAGDDEAGNAQAGAVILDIVAPLFAARSGG